ncbi:MAG: ferrochelatase [Acidiferrobacteraceae bacterium]|nr:ferrochelatase [Acidiferrobacteraceae bacterium]
MLRTAVVIYNLGGPDKLDSVEPFLFNLFNDPLILRQIAPIRWVLAKLISNRRTPVAKKIYEQIGGKSPILEETQKQASVLEKELKDDQSAEYRVFVAMRYWHPFVEECLKKVEEFSPNNIILLPLYPQFSTTTTESFLRAWRGTTRKKKIDIPTSAICCYPRQKNFIETTSHAIRKEIEKSSVHLADLKILFSAHGIPKKFVADGDPYQTHVTKTVAAIVDDLAIPNLDYITCYQSRVGPIEWLKPYTDTVILEAAKKEKTIMVVPVAFVSEHSETLVELDIEYRELAIKNGASDYIRIPTVGTNTDFIRGLAKIVKEAGNQSPGLTNVGGEPCDKSCVACPLL